MTSKTTGLRRRVPAGIIAAVMMGAALPAWSGVLSQPTGQINGRAPTATGTLKIRLPDGTEPATHSVNVPWYSSPVQFTTTPLNAASTVLEDADGDGPLSVVASGNGVSWSWMMTDASSTPLTAGQLSQSFFDSGFPVNSYVRVRVTAPALINSSTGAPNHAATNLNSTLYTLRLTSGAAKIRVNGYDRQLGATNVATMAHPIFKGAKYQFLMNGVDTSGNGDYTYQTDADWISIDSAGTVEYLEIPTHVGLHWTITVTNRESGLIVFKSVMKPTTRYKPLPGLYTLVNAQTACRALGANWNSNSSGISPWAESGQETGSPYNRSRGELQPYWGLTIPNTEYPNMEFTNASGWTRYNDSGLYKVVNPATGIRSNPPATSLARAICATSQ